MNLKRRGYGGNAMSPKIDFVSISLCQPVIIHFLISTAPCTNIGHQITAIRSNGHTSRKRKRKQSGGPVGRNELLVVMPYSITYHRVYYQDFRVQDNYAVRVHEVS